MCDCFHLAFPNWHAASSGIGDRRRLQGPEYATEDESICEEPSQFVEGERPRPQGSSPVEEYPEAAKYSDSDKKCDADHDSSYKSGSGHKAKRSGLVSMFERSSTPKTRQKKEVHSLDDGMIVETPKDGCGEGLIYGGGGKEGIFIKKVVPESPASKSLKVKEGDQILSATVYFDNVSFEDAVQILEHAQAYKVKLCLKRKPEIAETEPVLQSDTIPEEELSSVELREKGKTKRREEARISWPKISSFGKERKSCFTRSHSTPEADEQRKPVLSPTTSDTESPVKSRDALKGKKKHKITLSGLTKRSRVGLSEEQSKDSPKSGQISGHSHQTQESDMLLPDYLEGPSGETLEVIVTEDMKAEENLKALADQESLSGTTKTPDGKKKKKTTGKEKSHKKNTETKSPRRLKALGASFDIEDQPENEKSDVLSTFESNKNLLEEQPELDANTQGVSGDSLKKISYKSRTAQISLPKVELDISDVVFVQKSPQKEKKKKGQKGKDTRKKHQTGLSETAAKEEIQNVDVKESTAKSQQSGTESATIKEDPYARWFTGSVSTGQLPKREDIEIPGMVDVSTKKPHKPKTDSSASYEETQAETVQLSIDVDRVKEAVSKLPGFKLPQVDTSGALIPEEKTVIDANAQRIFMRTRTKVSETRAKEEAHLTDLDTMASQKISKTRGESDERRDKKLTGEVTCDVKLPELDGIEYIDSVDESAAKTDGGLTGFVINIDAKPTASVSVLETNNEKQTGEAEDQILRPPKQEVVSLVSSGEKKIIVHELEIKSPKKKEKCSKFKLPHLDVSVPKIKGSISDFSTSKKYVPVTETKGKAEPQIPEGPERDASLDVLISVGKIRTEEAEEDIKPLETQGELDRQASKGKTPKFEIEMPKIKGLELDFNLLKKSEDVKTKVQLPEGHKSDVSPDRAETVTSGQKTEVDEPDMKIQTLEAQDKQGSRFKIPTLGIKMPKINGQEYDFHLSKDEARDKLCDICLPETSESDVTPKKLDVCIPKQEAEVEKPEQMEAKPDVEGGRFKMPKFGFKMPKMKGPEFDLGFSKKDEEVRLPEAKAEVQLPESPKTKLSISVPEPQQKSETEKPEQEVKPLQIEGEPDVDGGRFKIPTFGIKMPKLKGPELDIGFSKKDTEVSLPEAKAEAQLPECSKTDINMDISMPDQKLEVEKPDQEVRPSHIESEPDLEGGKFKIPKFGITVPKMKGPDFQKGFSKKDEEVFLPEAKAGVQLPQVSKTDINIDVSLQDQKLEVEKPEQEVRPLQIEGETDVEGGRFKMPKFGFKMPKMKGPELDIGFSKKDADVKLPETKAGVQLPECSKTDINIDISMPDHKMEVEKPEQEIKPLDVEGETDVAGGRFKIPKFGMTMPKIKGPDFDISSSKIDADVKLPEAKAEVQLPQVSKTDMNIDISLQDQKMEVEKPEQEVRPLQIEGKLDVEGGRFKMPKFGFKMPKIKGPELDIGFSKKDADVKLPEAKAEVQLPQVSKMDINIDISTPGKRLEVEKPEQEIKTLHVEGETDVEGGRFKIPKFGMTMPKIKGPDFDISSSKIDADVKLPEAKAEVQLPQVSKTDMNIDVSLQDQKMEVEKPEQEVRPLQIEGKSDVEGGRFKMPKFGITMPKMKGPDFQKGFSKKDEEVFLPEAKAGVQLPQVSKTDINIDVSLQDQKMEVEKPEQEVRPLQIEGKSDVEGGRFKMPKFGFKMPKIKGPELDIGFSKKDAEVKLPEAKAEFQLPECSKTDINIDISMPDQRLEVEKPEQEIKPLHFEGESDLEGGKFKIPKFGITMPKMKGPDFQKGFSKKDEEVFLPEAKAGVQLPQVSKTDINIDVSLQDQKLEVEKPEQEVRPLQIEGETDVEGGRFKMPKFGFKMPKIKGPELDIGFSKKDADVKLPETKAGVQLPECSKTDINIDISMPDHKMEVEKPEQEIKPLDVEGETDVAGGRFKIPKFGMTMPKIKGPDFDISSSKIDADVKLPEAKAEVQLPQVSKTDINIDVSLQDQKMEVEKPEQEVRPLQIEGKLDVEGGRFKMPKFGFKMPKIKGPELDIGFSKKDAEVKLPEAKAEVQLPECSKTDINMDISMPDQRLEVEKPEQEVRPLHFEGESDLEGGKFKIPKFGITMPKIKGPDFDISSSKIDADVKLPEAKTEVQLPECSKTDINMDISMPDQKLEVEKPELEVRPLHIEGEPDLEGGKFKIPKFGITMPKMKGPDLQKGFSKKDEEVFLPEAKAGVQLPQVSKTDINIDVSLQDQKLEVEKPEQEVRPLQIEGETDVEGGRFKMPKFGFKMPKIKGPELDIGFSKKDADVKLPETKAGVQLPECSKTDINIDISMPDHKMEVEKPEQEIKPLDVEGETDVAGGRFKIPKFGMTMPKIKGPDFDISSSKIDADVKLPEAKAEVQLPQVSKTDINIDVSLQDQKMEVEKPEQEVRPLQIEGKLDVEGGRFKMPKFGFKMPKIKGPELDIGFSKKDADVKLPETKAEVQFPECSKTDINMDISMPDHKMEVEKPEQQIKPLHVEGEPGAEGGRFKIPKFGMTMPKIKGPDFDISSFKKDADVKLPETKLPECSETDMNIDISMPDKKMEVENPEQEIKPLQIEGKSDVEGGRFKMPKFGILMPKIKGPDFDISSSKNNTEVNLPEAKAGVQNPECSKTDFNIDISIPNLRLKVEKPEQEVKHLQIEGEPHGQGTKFKMPKLGITVPKAKGPNTDLSSLKKDDELVVAESNRKIKLSKAEQKESSAKLGSKAPEMKSAEEDVEGSPSKFKTPSFKMPTFGVSSPRFSAETQIKSTEKVITVDTKTPDTVLGPPPDVDTKAAEADGKKSRFKMSKLGISFPKIKSPEKKFNLSKKAVDVSLPEGRLSDVESKAPQTAVDLNIEGSPSKLNIMTFKDSKLKADSPNIFVKTLGTDDGVKSDGCTISLPEEELTVCIKAPRTDETDQPTKENDFKRSKFQISPSSFSMPKIKGPKLDISLSKPEKGITLSEVQFPQVDGERANISVPETLVMVKTPGDEGKALEIECKEDDLKISKTGTQIPKITEPEFHLGRSKKEAALTTLEPKVDIDLSRVEIKASSTKVQSPAPEMKDQTSLTFKMPNIRFSASEVKDPDTHLDLTKKEKEKMLSDPRAEVELPKPSKVDVSLGKVEIFIPEGKVEAGQPEEKIKPSPTRLKQKGQEGRFKMPKLGITMPKVKGPESDSDLSKKNVDRTPPEAKVLHVEVEEPAGKLEHKAVEVQSQLPREEQSQSKFKLPTFKLPKFRTAPEVNKEIKMEDPTFKIPENEDKDRSLKEEMTMEGEGKDSMSLKIGTSLPKIQGLKIDLGSSNKEGTSPKSHTDAQLPEAPEVNLGKVDPLSPKPNLEMKSSDVERKPVHGQVTSFKVPTFGLSVSKVEAPQIDLGLTKTDADVTISKSKAEVSLPGADMDKPGATTDIKAAQTEPPKTAGKGSPSKYKLPTFKFPKIGVVAPNVSGKASKAEKRIQIEDTGREVWMPSKGVDVPEAKVEAHMSDVEIPECTLKVKEKKISVKSQEIRLPKETTFGIDLSSSKKDEDLKVPEAKVKKSSAEAEATAPEVKVGKSKEGSPLKFKVGSLKFPKLGLDTPSFTTEAPHSDKDGQVGEVDTKISAVAPSTEYDTSSSVSKTDVDVTIQEAKDKTRAPKGNERSPIKFRIPTLKLPNFGVGISSTSVKESTTEKDVNVDGSDVGIPTEVPVAAAPKMEIEVKSIDMNITETEDKVKGSKFKLPSIGLSLPQAKGPDIDLNLSNINEENILETKTDSNAEVKLSEDESNKSSAEVETKAPEIKVVAKNTDGSPSKFKMPSFKLPKFRLTSQSSTEEAPPSDKDAKTGEGKLSEEVLAITIVAPSTETEGPMVDIKSVETGHKGKGIDFKLPSLGFSVPKAKESDTDLSLKADVRPPEAKAEVKLPNNEPEKTSEMENKGPTIDFQVSNVEESTSKFKMPTFKLPRLGVSNLQAGVDIPDMDKDAEAERQSLKVEETKAEVKDPTGSTIVPDRPVIEGYVKVKKTSWTLPRFSFSKVSKKPAESDINREADESIPETKTEGRTSDVNKGSSSTSAVGETATDLDAKLKKSKFSVLKPSTRETGFDVSMPKGHVSLLGEKVEEQPDAEAELPECETRLDSKEGKGKMLVTDLNISQKNIDVTLPGLKAEGQQSHVRVKQPMVTVKVKSPKIKSQAGSEPLNVEVPDLGVKDERHKTEIKISELEAGADDQGRALKLGDTDITQVKEFSAGVEAKASEAGAKSKDVRGSPLKFKMPSLKMPKFGSASQNASTGPHSPEKVAKSDATAIVKGPNIDLKTDATVISDTETSTTKADGEGRESPSRFKLPTFKIPQLGLSVPKPEEHIDDDLKESQLKKKVDPKEEGKPPKLTLTSFDKILKTIDVEFGVTKVEKAEPNLETSKKAHETDEPTARHLEAKETRPKGDSEKADGFKPSGFGLSSPSNPKTPGKAKLKDDSTPEGEGKGEEISPTCSVQSSDAFADISSTITSEPAGPHLPSPTKVTVKYSYPKSAPGLELHSDVFTSTTRTELISDVINLSSRVLSSFEDAPRPESGQIHIITSNIRTTSEAHQSGGGHPSESEADGAAALDVGGSQTGQITVFERRTVSEISRENIRSKEALVITKQVTKIFDTPEPISGETASSLQRLKESVHSDKMRFFEEAEK